jgi:hypothetical protein
MEILHTTGIHKQGVDQKKVKKVKKRLHHQRAHLFFNFFSIVEKTGNIQMLAS